MHLAQTYSQILHAAGYPDFVCVSDAQKATWWPLQFFSKFGAKDCADSYHCSDPVLLN